MEGDSGRKLGEKRAGRFREEKEERRATGHGISEKEQRGRTSYVLVDCKFVRLGVIEISSADLRRCLIKYNAYKEENCSIKKRNILAQYSPFGARIYKQ